MTFRDFVLIDEDEDVKCVANWIRENRELVTFEDVFRHCKQVKFQTELLNTVVLKYLGTRSD